MQRAGHHLHRLALQLETRLDAPRPEIQRMPGALKILGPQGFAPGLQHDQSHSSQSESMGIGPQPLSGRGTVLQGIGTAFAIGTRHLNERVLQTVTLRIGRYMPAPVGKGRERNPTVVKRLEGLKSGQVRGETKSAVANGQGLQRIRSRDRHLVAGNDFLTVDDGVRDQREKRGNEDRQ